MIAEFLKYGGIEPRNQLLLLVKTIWRIGFFQYTKRGTKLPSSSNYRGISLLNFGYKVFTNIF